MTLNQLSIGRLFRFVNTQDKYGTHGCVHQHGLYRHIGPHPERRSHMYCCVKCEERGDVLGDVLIVPAESKVDKLRQMIKEMGLDEGVKNPDG